MSNIITKAHPVPDMHSTGLRVVGAWLCHRTDTVFYSLCACTLYP